MNKDTHFKSISLSPKEPFKYTSKYLRIPKTRTHFALDIIPTCKSMMRRSTICKLKQILRHYWNLMRYRCDYKEYLANLPL